MALLNALRHWLSRPASPAPAVPAVSVAEPVVLVPVAEPQAGPNLGSRGANVRLGQNVEFVGNPAGIHLGDRVRIEDGARIVCAADGEVRIGDHTVIQARAILDTGPGGRIELGAFCTVNPYCVIYGHGGLVAGDYVRIAAHTVIIPANHVFEATDVPIARQGLTKEGIRIGRDVWIGSGCRILDGVVIGDGAVLAAGAVVTRAVEPMTVVAGVPARPLKRRGADPAVDSDREARA